MSYQVKFRSKDLPSITLDDQKGEKLKALWFNENQRNTPVEIGDDAYLVGDIKSIVKVSAPVDYVPITKEPLRIDSNKCHAQYSIQCEINNIAREYPDWAKKIRDKRWREDMRQNLWEITQEWCDDKKGTCNCDDLQTHEQSTEIVH